MIGSETVRLTSTEQKTAKLKARFAVHIREWWPKEDARFGDKEYNYHIEDPPFELWSCILSNQQTQTTPEDTAAPSELHSISSLGQKDDVTIWLLWNKKEISSYDNEGEAYIDFINGQKAIRLDSKLKYYTSPLVISAFIAIILIILIAALEIFHYSIPDQLWSIFTAVIAFYFGKETSVRSSTQQGDD